MTPQDTLQVETASRRVAAFAALRQIRAIVDAELANEQVKAVWVKRFSAIGGMGLIMFVTWAVYLAAIH